MSSGSPTDGAAPPDLAPGTGSAGWFERAKPGLVVALLVVLVGAVGLVLAQSAGLIHWSFLGAAAEVLAAPIGPPA